IANGAPAVDQTPLGPIGGSDPSFDALLREFEVSTAPKEIEAQADYSDPSPELSRIAEEPSSPPVPEQPSWPSGQDAYDLISNLAGSYGRIEAERLHEAATRDYKAEVDRLQSAVRAAVDADVYIDPDYADIAIRALALTDGELQSAF